MVTWDVRVKNTSGCSLKMRALCVLYQMHFILKKNMVIWPYGQWKTLIIQCQREESKDIKNILSSVNTQVWIDWKGTLQNNNGGCARVGGWWGDIIFYIF